MNKQMLETFSQE